MEASSNYQIFCASVLCETIGIQHLFGDIILEIESLLLAWKHDSRNENVIMLNAIVNHALATTVDSEIFARIYFRESSRK